MSEYAKNIQTIEDMWKKRIELRMGRTDGIMTELLPCPFCGGKAELHPTYDMDTNEVDGWFAWCNNDRCECKPETNQHFTEAEAIEVWNTRAERVGERKTINKTDDFVTHDSRAERTCHNLRQHGYNYLECSSCGEKSYQGDKAFDYCPNCGARVKK